MKTKLFVLLCVLFLYDSVGLAQGITPAPPDKAVVYFVRTSAFGFAINFTFFDSTKFIAKFNGTKYVRYECEPGKHLFWARSENRDYVEATVEAGKIYFIEAFAGMGAIKASVNLDPLLTTDANQMKNALDLIYKKEGVAYTDEQRTSEGWAMSDVIERGMNKYAEEKAKGKTMTQLMPDQFHPLESLVRD